MYGIRFYEAHGFEKIRSFMVEENGMNLTCDLMKKMIERDYPGR